MWHGSSYSRQWISIPNIPTFLKSDLISSTTTWDETPFADVFPVLSFKPLLSLDFLVSLKSPSIETSVGLKVIERAASR